MPRITKGMVEAAYSALEGIHDLAIDPQAYGGRHATNFAPALYVRRNGRMVFWRAWIIGGSFYLCGSTSDEAKRAAKAAKRARRLQTQWEAMMFRLVADWLATRD